MAFRALDSRARGQEHAVRPVRAFDPDGQRLEPREPGRVVLQDPARRRRRRWRTRRTCSWPCASTATSATTIRSSVGRRTSTTRRPRTSRRRRSKTDPASGEQRIGGTAVEGAKPLYEVVYDATTGDIKHDRTGQVTPPKFPYRGQVRGQGKGHRAASNWPTGSLRPTTSISPAAMSIGCGATCWASASSSRSTTSAPATRPAIRSCSTT